MWISFGKVLSRVVICLILNFFIDHSHCHLEGGSTGIRLVAASHRIGRQFQVPGSEVVRARNRTE